MNPIGTFPASWLGIRRDQNGSGIRQRIPSGLFRPAGSGLDGIRMGPESSNESHRDFSNKLARD